MPCSYGHIPKGNSLFNLMVQVLKFTLQEISIFNMYVFDEMALEYDITFLSIEKTGRKPCSSRKHIICIVMVSERDFENVACVWSYNVYAL